MKTAIIISSSLIIVGVMYALIASGGFLVTDGARTGGTLNSSTLIVNPATPSAPPN